jgi:hypothetical protein
MSQRLNVTVPDSVLSYLSWLVTTGKALSRSDAARSILAAAAAKRPVEVVQESPRKKNPSPLAVPDFNTLTDGAVLAWLAVQGLVTAVRRVAPDSPVYHCRWSVESRVATVNGSADTVRGLVEKRCTSHLFDKFVQEDFTPFEVLRRDVERIMKERAEGGAAV